MSGQRARAEVELEEIDRLFKALGHASRRHILLVINARGGRMAAGDIAARFACRWPTTSRHLRVLEAARLVQVEAAGRTRYYRLDVERLRRVGAGWFDWFQSAPAAGEPPAAGRERPRNA